MLLFRGGLFLLFWNLVDLPEQGVVLGYVRRGGGEWLDAPEHADDFLVGEVHIVVL